MQILSEVISLAGYLHSGSIFLNCANVDIAYNTQSQYHVVPKKLSHLCSSCKSVNVFITFNFLAFTNISYLIKKGMMPFENTNIAERGQMGPKGSNRAKQAKQGCFFLSNSTKSGVTFLVLVRGNFLLYHLKAYVYSFILSCGFNFLGAPFMVKN